MKHSFNPEYNNEYPTPDVDFVKRIATEKQANSRKRLHTDTRVSEVKRIFRKSYIAHFLHRIVKALKNVISIDRPRQA
jgi:hypothetical protein